MHLRVIGLSQQLSFEDGSMVNLLNLELPDGTQLQAAIEDEGAARVTSLFLQAGGGAAQRALAVAKVGDAVQVALPAGQPYAGRVVPTGPPPVDSRQMPAGQYSPLELTENSEGVMEFGGGDDLSADAVHAAESALAAAPEPMTQLGAQVHKTVEAVRRSLQPTVKAVTVQADAKGNPVLKGAGLVDLADLIGGNGAGEEPGEVNQL